MSFPNALTELTCSSICWILCFCVSQLVMTHLQSILENVDTPELLRQSVKCILQVAHCYPHVFSINFRVSLFYSPIYYLLCSLRYSVFILNALAHVSTGDFKMWAFFTGYGGYIGGLAHRPHSEAVGHTASLRLFAFPFYLVIILSFLIFFSNDVFGIFLGCQRSFSVTFTCI